MNKVGFFVLSVLAGIGLLRGPAVAQETLTREILSTADYMAGKNSFAMRCSACHTYAESSMDLTGPNLSGVFDRQAGSKESFEFSETLVAADFTWTPDQLDAWLADPQGFLPGNAMSIPTAVPDNERTALISFVMIETGAVDWPRPETNFTESQTDTSLPFAERFPSFWNHMMTNTTRYRWNTGDEDYIFEIYYQTDGTITSNQEGLAGFWHITEKNFFCYALYGLSVEPTYMVQCFPVAAMSIPRFAEELWSSTPYQDVTLYGGIMPGRP